MHPGHTQRSQFSQKFLELLDISSAEQLAMGIPQEQIPPDNGPSTYNSPRATKRRAQDPLPCPRQTKILRST